MLDQFSGTEHPSWISKGQIRSSFSSLLLILSIIIVLSSCMGTPSGILEVMLCSRSLIIHVELCILEAKLSPHLHSFYLFVDSIDISGATFGLHGLGWPGALSQVGCTGKGVIELPQEKPSIQFVTSSSHLFASPTSGTTSPVYQCRFSVWRIIWILLSLPTR